MAPTIDIPGYYYDSEKRRYFKIENSKTAPTNASWSSKNVLKRKLHEEDAAVAQRYFDLAKSRVTRAGVLNDAVTGGFFAREYGVMKDDMQAACFAAGLVDKGFVRLVRGRNREMQAKHICAVGSDYKTGLCPVYADVSEVLISTYLVRDKNKRLDNRLLANYRLPRPEPLPYIEVHIPQISDIQFHAPSNSMLLTSRQPFSSVGVHNYNCLWMFKPEINTTDDEDSLRPNWVLPSRPSFTMPVCQNYPGIKHYESLCVAPAPDSSSLIAMVGTNRGIIRWDDTVDPLTWLTPPKRGLKDTDFGMLRNVFTISFDPGQSRVMHLGGRPGALFTADTRVSYKHWSYLRLRSPITHVKSLDGGNRVLVAGLRDQLGVYDLRFVRSHRSSEDHGDTIDIDMGNVAMKDSTDLRTNDHSVREGNKRLGGRGSTEKWKRTEKTTSETIAEPVVRFEQYRNKAHINIGFAYDAETGIVAAAHDSAPDTVALYSVRTGSQLRVFDLATKGAPTSQPSQRSFSDPPSVVQAMQFHTFPGDHTPTLLVGAGGWGSITALSFGVEDLKDEA